MIKFQLLLRASAMTLAFGTTSALAQTIALTHGRILRVSGPEIADGTILIRDGKIIAVGSDVAVPGDAEVRDLKGATVTPGFVAADTSLGIVEVSSVAGTNDVRAATPKLSAGIDLQYALNPDSTPLDVALLGGVTSAIVLPEAGAPDAEAPRLFAGQGAAISLGHDAAILVRSHIGVTTELGERGAQQGGGSRASATVLLKAALDEVRRYTRNKGAFERDPGSFTLSRPDLDALVPVLEGRTPLIVGAHRVSDIREAITLAHDYRLKLVLRGGEEAWRLAPELAAAKIGVIVTPTDNLPKSFETLAASTRSAERLSAAGVRVAIIGNDASYRVREMRYNAGMVVARGMPYADALRALTLTPAQLFGVDDLMGSIDVGKRADIVVWSGDPFEPLSQPQAIYISGIRQPLESRATALAHRYAGTAVAKPTEELP